MKLSFNEDQSSTQQAIRPDQRKIRQSPIRHFPIGRLFLLFIFLAVVAFGVKYVVESRQMRIFGVVSSQNQIIAAPQAGFIREMYVTEGQRVKKGDLLMRFQPHTASFALTSPTLNANQEKVSPDSMPITRAQYAVEKAKNEVERLEQLFREAEKKREVDIEIAQMEMDAMLEGSTAEEANRKSAILRNQIEVQKLEEFLATKQERTERIEKLIKMDAAVSEQLKVAKHEVRLAQHNLEQARVDLAQAKQTSDKIDPMERRRMQSQLQLAKAKGNPYEQLLAQARIDLKVAKQNVELIQEDPNAEINIEYPSASPEMSMLKIYAAFDGIVTRVNGASGSLIGSQNTILTVSGTEENWIRIYVRPDQAANLHQGAKIRIYVPKRATDRKSVV